MCYMKLSPKRVDEWVDEVGQTICRLKKYWLNNGAMLWKLLSSPKDVVLVLKRELLKYSSLKWDKNLYSWWKWKQKSLSCVRLFVTPWTVWNSPGQDTRVSSLSLLQGIFPTQGSNSDFLHCRQILYQLRHKGSPRILEWVAYSFSSGSSWPRNQTGVSYTAGGFFTNWTMREVLYSW